MNDRDRLVRDINAALTHMNPTRSGKIPAPAIINDNQADPTLRRTALRLYVSSVLETPTGDWSKEMRDAVQTECRNVLLEGGY